MGTEANAWGSECNIQNTPGGKQQGPDHGDVEEGRSERSQRHSPQDVVGRGRETEVQDHSEVPPWVTSW